MVLTLVLKCLLVAATGAFALVGLFIEGRPKAKKKQGIWRISIGGVILTTCLSLIVGTMEGKESEHQARQLLEATNRALRQQEDILDQTSATLGATKVVIDRASTIQGSVAKARGDLGSLIGDARKSAAEQRIASAVGVKTQHAASRTATRQLEALAILNASQKQITGLADKAADLVMSHSALIERGQQLSTELERAATPLQPLSMYYVEEIPLQSMKDRAWVKRVFASQLGLRLSNYIDLSTGRSGIGLSPDVWINLKDAIAPRPGAREGYEREYLFERAGALNIWDHNRKSVHLGFDPVLITSKNDSVYEEGSVVLQFDFKNSVIRRHVRVALECIFDDGTLRSIQDLTGKLIELQLHQYANLLSFEFQHGPNSARTLRFTTGFEYGGSVYHPSFELYQASRTARWRP